MKVCVHTNDDLELLRTKARDWAHGFRTVAFTVDQNPLRIKELLDLPGLRELAHLNIPEPFNRHPLSLGGRKRTHISAIERAVLYEELGYGDAGVVLAAPGPAMSGPVVAAMGNAAQKEAFYSYFAAKPTWTFFGLSEPRFGSDPQSMETRLEPSLDSPGELRLNGEKAFNGGGVLAEVGVVFARSKEGPGGIDVVLFHRAGQLGFSATLMPLYGLRGTISSQLRFVNCPLSPDMILGQMLSPARRFQVAAIDVFAGFRPCVAALALGVTRATLDYARQGRRTLECEERWQLEAFERRVDMIRHVVHAACRRVDTGDKDATHSGLAKTFATRLAEDVTAWVPRLFGQGALLADPWLNLWYRNARAFEYMEGTTHIQRLNTFQSYMRGRCGVP